MKTFIGIGNAGIDITAHLPSDDALRHFGFVKGSCTFPDAVQARFLMNDLPSPTFEPGGVAANVMCAYAALGGNARFIGKTGRDAMGDMFAASMRDSGVAFDT